MRISRPAVRSRGLAVERSEVARCAAAVALLGCATALAQPASMPSNAAVSAASEACVLAPGRVDPAAFARARSRHQEALRGCMVDPVTHGQREAAAPVVRTPAPVRIDPAAAPAFPPTSGERPSAVQDAEPPAPGHAKPATQGRAFTDRMRALAPQVDEVARRNEIDPLLLHALIHVESRHRIDAVSPAGARGPMQLMPQTAARFGVHAPAHLHEAPFNLAAGAAYLKMLQGEFGGDLDLALAAYNAGEGAVRRHGGRIPPYPETQAYVRDVRAMYRRLQAQWEAESMASGGGGRSAFLAMNGARR
jgi:soluble lytic murein transglycosylase-like protein